MINFFLTHPLNLFSSIFLAFLTSFALSLLLANNFISFILSLKKSLQPIRTDGPKTHLQKQGTPALGGLLIVFTFLFSTIIWLPYFNGFNVSILLVIVGFAIIGFIDDYLKLAYNNSKGLSGKLRLAVGFLFSALAIYTFMQYQDNVSTSINILFSAVSFISVGFVVSLLFGCFVVVGTANSVNLTDGLDGLASQQAFLVLLAFLIYIVLVYFNLLPNVTVNFSVKYIANILPVAVIISALMGSVLGFLWVNSAPAQIFMGDVGSLTLGGAIGVIAVALKQEVFLAIVGLIFVLESLSVILQVYYFKLSKGKRLFLMAPLHHHFEQKGIAESKVVARMYILTMVFVVLGLAVLIFFGN